MPTNNQEWEERLEQLYIENTKPEKVKFLVGEIKSFIRQEIRQAKIEAYNDGYQHGVHDAENAID